MLNKRTWCIICRNCCSIGVQSAEMTGSLWRHTAAIKVHGEFALSTTVLVCKVARQIEVLKNCRNPLFPAAVLLKQDRNVKTDRLAILLQGAAIFFCYIQVYAKKPRNAGDYSWQRGSAIFLNASFHWWYQIQDIKILRTRFELLFLFLFLSNMRQLDCFLRALSECSTDNFTFTSVYEVHKGSMFIFLPTILCKKRTVDLD